MARAQSNSATKASLEEGFASLGPTLLARKGGAKPAMRPQLAPLPGVDTALSAEADALEDLGWNDMGENPAATPKPRKKRAPGKKSKSAKAAAEKQKRRAAFTLRLDADRHLKLRLAATMHGMSAQALVTEAIDAVFGEIEDLDALAARMQRN